jgi:hypothetical protein
VSKESQAMSAIKERKAEFEFIVSQCEGNRGKRGLRGTDGLASPVLIILLYRRLGVESLCGEARR